MKKLFLLALIALLPIASATPQTYGNTVSPIVAGRIAPAFTSAGDGLQEGTGPCNGVNFTGGTWTNAQGTSVQNHPAFDVDCILSNSAAYDLKIGTAGSQPQNYFSYVRVVDCAGVTRTFTSASATFSTTGGRTWTWGTGSSVVLNVASCVNPNGQVWIYR